MTAQAVAQLLEELGVTKSHSRPHTSDDNPFSEAQFKTLKYRLDYPERFESLADAREWVTAFFDWYNNEHRHSSLGLMTPAAVHWGLDRQLTLQRQQVLQTAYATPRTVRQGLAQTTAGAGGGLDQSTAGGQPGGCHRDGPADGGNPSVNRRTVWRRGGVKGRRLFADLRSP